MSFGPELSVAYVGDPLGNVDQVRLAPYISADAKVMFAQMQDDPAMEFLGPYGRTWQTGGPDSYINTRVEREDTAAWGVWRGDEQVGMAELFRYPGDVVSYAVVLRPDSRDKGIGSLVTAGLVTVAFARDVLADHFDDFSIEGARGMTTTIHIENEPSQRMCGNFGFIAVNTGKKDVWRDYVMPQLEHTAHFGVSSRMSTLSAQIRQRALAAYHVQVL